jgi:TRAP-type uncharacterized transport system fused permease subunit
MLRRKRFTRIEIVILCVLGMVLLAAGLGGVFLTMGRPHWRLALASLGILIIAALYLVAAKRGRPL